MLEAKNASAVSKCGQLRQHYAEFWPKPKGDNDPRQPPTPLDIERQVCAGLLIARAFLGAELEPGKKLPPDPDLEEAKEEYIRVFRTHGETVVQQYIDTSGMSRFIRYSYSWLHATFNEETE